MLLSIQGITKRFGDELALADVSFDVAESEIVWYFNSCSIQYNVHIYSRKLHQKCDFTLFNGVIACNFP